MTHEEKALLVSQCETFEELEECFRKIEPVPGSHKEYYAEKLIGKIPQIREFSQSRVQNRGLHGKVPFNIFTRTYGIRAKVMELFWYEINKI